MKIFDSFFRPTRDLPGVTPDSWSWIADTGTGTSAYRIYNGQLARKGDSKQSTVYPSFRCVTEDQTFLVSQFGGSITAAGSSTLWAGFQLRYIDAANYHHFRFNAPMGATPASITIAQVGGAGGNTVTYSFPGLPPALFDFSGKVQRQPDGSVKATAYVNGVEVLTHTSTVAVAWPTTDSATRGRCILSGYSNSARVDTAGYSWYADELTFADLVQPSRYRLTRWNGTAEVLLKPENFFVEYRVGELVKDTDVNYPNGLTSMPSYQPVSY